jgi:hypothetical protein
MFKLLKIYRFFVPNLTVISFGGGSSSTSATLTPEQKELLQLQTAQLRDVFMPAYTSTVQGAKGTYDTLSPYANKASLNAFNTYGDVSKNAITGATNAYTSGMTDLSKLFDPNYESNQINAALQAGRESARESQLGQNAMYGGAGGLGSSRMALADKNLSSLNAQRQATAAAGAQAQVQANRMAAANSMFGAGQSLANIGMSATGNQMTAAQSPMDLYSKYAGIVFGTPQASTTPNFAGTQGSNTSGFGFGVTGIGGGNSPYGSDVAIKQNIQKIGVLDNGLNLYKYEYKNQYKDTWGHGQQIGVMAQDVEKVKPEAVSMHPDGYKMVNYSMVM